MVLEIFKIAPRMRHLHVFIWQSMEVLNVFNTLNFNSNFLEKKKLFQKTGYRFLVECTKIKKASFPFKTALWEANVKINKMETTKWTYHKEWSFVSNCFIFLENLFQF